MIDPLVVELSRWQFAATALYHFLFVPLTLGLAFILAAMETVYVATGKTIYRDMAQFWGKLFAINFALGVATGLTMEFQFGTNWSYYSSFVGDVFGAPLAIEGLMAFFLESTFVGLMLLGWHRLGKVQHLIVTYAVAFGSNLSALWILVANAFMQDPVGAHFNPVTQRMELSSFLDLIFSPDAQAKFVHTSLAGYVTASIFVVGISAWYMRKGRHLELAKRSLRMASVFGVLAIIGTISLGDALGLVDQKAQPMKLAAMEGMWDTYPAPAPFSVFAIPDDNAHKNRFDIQIPDVLGLLVTHDTTTVIPGIKDLVVANKARIVKGVAAVQAMHELVKNPHDPQALATAKNLQADLGYGRLLERYAPEVATTGTYSQAALDKAAWDTVPSVFGIFLSFRFMVAMGFAFLLFLILAAVYSFRGVVQKKRWFLTLGLFMVPLPFLTNLAGWLVAELGRQPWTVFEILPTYLSASTHSVSYMIFSLAGFLSLYSLFIIIEMYLMIRSIRLGPADSPPSPPAPAKGGMAANPTPAYKREEL